VGTAGGGAPGTPRVRAGTPARWPVFARARRKPQSAAGARAMWPAGTSANSSTPSLLSFAETPTRFVDAAYSLSSAADSALAAIFSFRDVGYNIIQRLSPVPLPGHLVSRRSRAPRLWNREAGMAGRSGARFPEQRRVLELRAYYRRSTKRAADASMPRAAALLHNKLVW
jgi:hypothetical protein